MNQLNNVVSKSLYDLAIDTTQNNIPGWITNQPNGSKIVVPRNIPKPIDDDSCIVYNFKHDYISNRLKFPLIQLSHFKPMFISAQTGAGKTSFIFETIYPELIKQNKKLLIFVSRSPLKNKVKYDAINAAGTEHKKCLTPYGIEKEHHFGDIDIYSYQDFCLETAYHHLAEINLSNYGAIIFDECHFFTSDSDFNCSTEYILHALTNFAFKRNIPRIYMTGTPDIVFDNILETEKRLWHNTRTYNNFNMSLYHFERDYHYINISTFKNDPQHDSLYRLINSSIDTKWIIFVDSKSLGKTLQDKFSSSKMKTMFISSDTLHNHSLRTAELNDFLTELTDKENLTCDILIATKCLDVGITIKNKNVNIVNFLTDKVDFLQSIGRKRIGNNETVKLLIPQYNLSNVRNWLKNAETKYKEFNTLCQKYPEGIYANGNSFTLPVYVHNGQYKHNHLSIRKLRYTRHELTNLLNTLEATPNNTDSIINNYFASWLIGCNFNTNENIDQTEQEILDIITPHMHSSFNKETFDLLCEKLKPYDKRSDKRETRSFFSTRTFNSIIKPLSQNRSLKYLWYVYNALIHSTHANQ